MTMYQQYKYKSQKYSKNNIIQKVTVKLKNKSQSRNNR